MRLTIKISMIFIFLVLASACSASSEQMSAGTTGETIEIDSTFREFHQNLGGKEILGPAISPIFHHENIVCQYTENSLMCFNNLAEDPNRLYLFGLANTFEIEPFEDTYVSNSSQDRIVDNIVIYEEFQPLYDRLYGARYVGKPLTPVRFNPYKQRIEQYFENVGFYRLLEDPPGEVHLLSYGVYVCDAHCRSQGQGGSAVTNPTDNVNVPFLPYIIRMGSPAAFGEPVTKSFYFQENEIQQVYDSVVFIGNPDIPTSIRLLNIPELLNMPRHIPGPQVYTEADGMVFYPVYGTDGYHVPLDFDRFISRNGSITLSGNPISEVYAVVEGKIYRQCFQNYCLDFDGTKPNGQKVSMAPLGLEYAKYANLNEDLIVKFKFTPETVLFNISEVAAQIPASQEQLIDLVVLRRKDNQPLENIEAFLYLTLPNGDIEKYNFTPTDANGSSQFTIPPHPQLSNGDLVMFEVCLNIPTDKPICHQDNYLIWDHK
ncbi:MAG: hypothetical protein CL609_09040 [Anaerolineaceae bacterium]|nr:hypothetical protein [Anaerolineaceae bacterium]